VYNILVRLREKRKQNKKTSKKFEKTLDKPKKI
jgi:hypothetical protein